jgi:hypothetical protein
MDRLNGDFNRGYTKALIDIKNFFDSHSDALKLYRMYNCKGITALLSFIQDNREELRETGTIENIIVSKDKNKITIRRKNRMSSNNRDTKHLDAKQFDLMWNFLMMGNQKANIPALKENCEALRQAMIQKTAGQRNDPDFYTKFEELGTIINCIVIEAMALYLSGDLDWLE